MPSHLGQPVLEGDLCPECGHEQGRSPAGLEFRDHTPDCSRRYCEECGSETTHFLNCPKALAA
jgi:hypothetical protein